MPVSVVTLEQYRRIREVKAAREAIPSDAELAAELGLKVRTVHNVLHRDRKRLEWALRKGAARYGKEAQP